MATTLKQYRITYTTTDAQGLAFEWALDELNARAQFVKRFPKAKLETIKEKEPLIRT